MTELLLGRLVQMPFLAITWTVYSSPQCRSFQVQELFVVTHRCVCASRPVATAMYVSFLLLAIQLTEPILELHSTLATTAWGIQGPRDSKKHVNMILTIAFLSLETTDQSERQFKWCVNVRIGGKVLYPYE